MIKNEDDFERLMESIDNELKQKDLAIFQRPIHAWKTISARFNLRLRLNPQTTEIINDCFIGDNLTLKIFKWYDDRYGDKLNIDSTWKSAVFIKGDLYKIKIPKFYGKLEFVAPNNFADVEVVYPSYGIDETPKLNIFNLIEGITPNLIKTLNYEEVHNIMLFCCLGTDAKNKMEKHVTNLLIKQSISDILASINHLFEMKPNCGLSKWASLQATEKVLKAFIQKKKTEFPKTHNLSKLLKIAEEEGLVLTSSQFIDRIQCEAGIRYGEPEINLSDSINAHYATLIICREVSEQLDFV